MFLWSKNHFFLIAPRVDDTYKILSYILKHSKSKILVEKPISYKSIIIKKNGGPEVLELQGKEDETKKYWTEANLFKSLFETLDQKNDNI